MARVSLARQPLSDAGVTPVYTDAHVDGHRFENHGRVVIHVRNDSGADVLVWIRTGYARVGLRLADREVLVPARFEAFIGPFDTEVYNQRDADAGHVHVDYSSVDSVTVAALLLS